MSRSQRRREVGVGAFESFRVPFRRTFSGGWWAKIPSYYYSGQSAQANAFQAPVRANPPSQTLMQGQLRVGLTKENVSPLWFTWNVPMSAYSNAMKYLHGMGAARTAFSQAAPYRMHFQHSALSSPFVSGYLTFDEMDKVFDFLNISRSVWRAHYPGF